MHEQWINIIVDYIYKHYNNPPQVDAIVGPNTEGFVFDIIVAWKLHLPYIPICRVGEYLGFNAADPDDSLQYTYTDRHDKVCFTFAICHRPSVRPSVCRL